MKTQEFSAILSGIIITIGLFWYIRLVMRGKIGTVVASWIVSTVATTLSFVTYYTSPKANWLGGFLNATSAIAVGGTLIAVYARGKTEGQRVCFNPFQKKCLIASTLITILWIVMVWGMGGTGVIPNLLTQVLLIISYSMLIAKFWKADHNTESLVTWWCVLISSIIALYTAYAKSDALAFVYATRSTVMCGILIFALHRLERKNRK